MTLMEIEYSNRSRRHTVLPYGGCVIFEVHDMDHGGVDGDGLMVMDRMGALQSPVAIL